MNTKLAIASVTSIILGLLLIGIVTDIKLTSILAGLIGIGVGTMLSIITIICIITKNKK